MENKRTQAAGIVQRRQIEECAYAIWESQGTRTDATSQHWLRAEAELTRAVNTKPGNALRRARRKHPK